MKKPLFGIIAITLSLFISGLANAAQMKEWTVLVFLNGHNNLDPYGTLNMNQMKEVGSSDQVNIVVQWASLKAKQTRRIYVEKNSWKVIETMKPVDMGDYKELVNFVKWAHENYPAKKYFIDVWNHGNGWHRIQGGQTQIKPMDISYDDVYDSKITTEQLGQAMAEISKITGHKVELYGSDACLMAMAEVVGEMKDYVSYFAGSQETEPAEGWAYNKFLAPLVKTPTMNGGDLAKVLSKTYFEAYSGGIYGTKSVTFSAYDLSKYDNYVAAVKNLTDELKQLDTAGMQAAAAAIDGAQSFAAYDYKDFKDYLLLVGKGIRAETFANVSKAQSELVISNNVSNSYKKAQGISVWLPSLYEWNDYSERYQNLQFSKATGWGDFLNTVTHAQ
jgi:hypothetical protein